jgi:hypothetical protein
MRGRAVKYGDAHETPPQVSSREAMAHLVEADEIEP